MPKQTHKIKYRSLQRLHCMHLPKIISLFSKSNNFIVLLLLSKHLVQTSNYLLKISHRKKVWLLHLKWRRKTVKCCQRSLSFCFFLSQRHLLGKKDEEYSFRGVGGRQGGCNSPCMVFLYMTDLFKIIFSRIFVKQKPWKRKPCL